MLSRYCGEVAARRSSKKPCRAVFFIRLTALIIISGLTSICNAVDIIYRSSSSKAISGFWASRRIQTMVNCTVGEAGCQGRDLARLHLVEEPNHCPAGCTKQHCTGSRRHSDIAKLLRSRSSCNDQEMKCFVGCRRVETNEWIDPLETLC